MVKDRLLPVAGTFESHYQPITEHRILSHSFNGRDIANRRGVRGFVGNRRQRQ